MKYTVNNIALPVFFSASTKRNIAVGKAPLKSTPITALHYHNKAELGICVSGEGETHIGDRIYKFKSGDIQILPPMIPHLSKAYGGSDCVWIWITFDARELVTNAGFTSPEGVLSIASDANFLIGVYGKEEYPELTDTVNDIYRASQNEDNMTALALGVAVSRMLIISSRIKKSLENSDEDTFKIGTVNGNLGKIIPAMDFIGENLDDTEGLSEENLARMCKVSPATLRRLFIKYTGFSPKAFIIRSRMAYAEYLLRKTDMSVLDISLYVGYREVSGFIRTFKSFYGVTPSRYRDGK